MDLTCFDNFFEEHGIVMTLMSIRPKTIYSQRVARKWLRGQAVAGMVGTKEDYWQRELQYIGQQQLNNLEADVSAGVGGTFGFQDRYDEYRREESDVAGLFRTRAYDRRVAREARPRRGESAPRQNASPCPGNGPPDVEVTAVCFIPLTGAGTGEARKCRAGRPAQRSTVAHQ
jgi:hypothetical protein